MTKEEEKNEKKVRPLIDIESAIPDELKAIGGTASQVMGFFSGANVAISAVQTIGKFLGIFTGPESFEDIMKSRLDALDLKLDEILENVLEIQEVQKLAAYQNIKLHMADHMAALEGASLAVDKWWEKNRNAPNAASLRFESGENEGPNQVASRNALLALADDIYFREPTIAKPLEGWNDSTPTLDIDGLAFDYRRALPKLLIGITQRLKVIAASEPDFVATHLYDNELEIYVNRLKSVIDTIEKGIRTRFVTGGAVGIGPERGIIGYEPGAVVVPVWGASKYEVYMFGEAVDIHTGARVLHKIKGTFPGKALYDGYFTTETPMGYARDSYGRLMLVVDESSFSSATAERILYELSLRDKHHHGSGSETVEAQARARLLHEIGLFGVHAMIDHLETLIDGNRQLVRPIEFDHPNGLDGVIQTRVNGLCLEVVNGWDEPGARVAIAPADLTEFRSRQKWAYDQVTGQIRSEVGTCLALHWNHWDDYGSDYWTPSRYSAAITRGVWVTTLNGIAEPGKLHLGTPSLELDAQWWTFNPRTGFIRNALGGGTILLDVMWGNGAPGTRVWGWDANGSSAQRWHSYPTLTVAASLHPLGLNISWENSRGVVIRFHAAGFNTTQPVRLYRHPDYTGEDGISLPVNQFVEIVDPFPFQPGEAFTYEVTVWDDEAIDNRFLKLSGDRFDFRHPIQGIKAEELATRAYYHFEQRGRQHGDDWNDWFRAEGELRKGQ